MGDDVPAREAGERLLEDFLADPRNAALDLSTAVTRCATALGLNQVVVYLADVQQRHLISLTDVSPTLPVDASLGGWSYRTLSLRVEESPTGGMTVWLPLIDGAERLGVLAAQTTSLDAERLRHCRALAALIAMMITSRRAYLDTFVQRTRTEPMQLPAELLRAVMPPRTIGNLHAISTAVLEPAYEIGGDAFDHALTETTLHATILDAMGHNMASGLTTAVTLAACRNGRRTGADLPELVETVDRTLAEWFPDQFCTGVLTQLDLMSGALRWCNCGHPQPLLIRNERLERGALERPADPPMGLITAFLDAPRHVYEIDLEPGDRVLLYTDGVTEARNQAGAEFGLDRFADSIIRATAAGKPAPETLRHLIHAILDAQSNRLRDDATILLLEWRPPQAHVP
ncbi:serine/threonine-protein phosphatase [Streptomyces sp. PSKA54]|uniref:Serine/threonine-protein phosphatase n=1 Tax=Streptomyces himalayensis subsp. aureolus TaxID=2758039 RepID=A0A7W2CWU4_9ACTN|nr:PP2C family protein-serine/threonine phosphatase [Streptomyces himalayensis]MBA4860577.1 serine/threonine-protein phosphatase [Streptomyces himalayensis subsp. aureolus]